MIIDADTAGAPFGEHIGLGRQWFECGPIEFFEQLAPRHAEPADRPFIVELASNLADRLVQFGQAVETPIPQPPENPAFHDQHAASTLALSRGLRGRAGRTPVP